MGREVTRGERLVEHAVGAGRGGPDLSAGELLALQAGIYRYVETVDLASKLIDRAAQGAKTVVQGGSS